ncbi:MAG: hypothetical protein D6704_08160, partial [Nitrospirae bacterium]
LLDLYETSGDWTFLNESIRLAERILADFADPEQGGFFTTAHTHEKLIVRSREGTDGATPSGNAVAAWVLARLAFHADRDEFREAAVKAIRAYGRHIARIPRGFAKTLMALDFLLHGPVEVALIGMPGEPLYERLRRELHQPFLPYRVIAYGDPSATDLLSRHPLLRGKTLVQGQAAVYICRQFTCEAPLTDPAEVAQALRQRARSPSPESSGPKSSPGRPRSQLSGAATPEGTGQYASRILATAPQPPIHGFTSLGSTGLTVSRIGFGSYRVDLDHEEHRLALIKALREGCNLLDTSTNYGDGESEHVIGSVLAELITTRELTRDEVVIVSKIGYVQGRALARAKAREEAGNPFPELVKYGEGVWHCIHPEFLHEQLAHSLDRLGLATLDVCLLHNPEYFLADAKNRTPAMTPSALRDIRQEFYRRLQHAFTWLETQVAAGRLRYYGVSSNTCTAPPHDPEATSLSQMLEAAQAAAREADQPIHHFRVLQLPFNLLESGALLTPNTGPHQQHTVLDVAQAEQIAVLVNRPLNAILANHRGILRLADIPEDPVEVAFETQHDRVARLEEEYRHTFIPALPSTGHGAMDYFPWARELARIRPQVQGVEHWEQIESSMIVPHLSRALQVLDTQFTGEIHERWERWRTEYLSALLLLLRIMRHEAARKSRAARDTLVKIIRPFLPPDREAEPLARKALWILASTPGVTCVLNGMRKPHYVDDALTVLRWEPLSQVHALFKALRDVDLF